MKYCRWPIFLFFFFSTFSSFGNTKDIPADSNIQLPWSEFKQLLQIDKNQIELTVTEFQKLLRQTRPTQIPNFVVKEGKVVLSRKDFTTLLDSMQAPQPVTQLGEYLITRAFYDAIIKKSTTKIEAEYDIEVFPIKQEKSHVIVPLIQGTYCSSQSHIG